MVKITHLNLALQIYNSHLSDVEIRYIAEDDTEKFDVYSMGHWIRNKFKLWTDTEFVDKYGVDIDLSPDDHSLYVMYLLHTHINPDVKHDGLEAILLQHRIGRDPVIARDGIDIVDTVDLSNNGETWTDTNKC